MSLAERVFRGRRRRLAGVLVLLVVALIAVVFGVLVERTDSAAGTSARSPTGSPAPTGSVLSSATGPVPAEPSGVSAAEPSGVPAASAGGEPGPAASGSVGVGPAASDSGQVDPAASLPPPASSSGFGEREAPWPPPADPTGPVARAVADAQSAGIRQAVVVVDRASGTILTQVDQDRTFPSLSLVKLMIAADVLINGEGAGGGGPLDPNTRSMLRDMVAASDDVAGSDLYVRTGGDQMVERTVDRFGLVGTSPTPDGRYWGNVQTTAADMASLLGQLLADPAVGTVVGPDMLGATAIAADGVDQQFGMRTVPGAGSKQGWGCCLGGVLGLHSVGFTSSRIVVVLSSAEPDDYSLGAQDGLALQSDPGGQRSIAAITATTHAALGAPADSG